MPENPALTIDAPKPNELEVELLVKEPIGLSTDLADLIFTNVPAVNHISSVKKTETFKLHIYGRFETDELTAYLHTLGSIVEPTKAD